MLSILAALFLSLLGLLAASAAATAVVFLYVIVVDPVADSVRRRFDLKSPSDSTSYGHVGLVLFAAIGVGVVVAVAGPAAVGWWIWGDTLYAAVAGGGSAAVLLFVVARWAVRLWREWLEAR